VIASGTWQRSSDLVDRRDPVIDAMVQLLRLAADDEWTEDAAAPVLRQRVSDESVLWVARANVSKIMAQSSGWVIEQAAAVVESALRQGEPAGLEIDHVASCGWIHDRPCPRCDPDL
jgi:hypothetical protein